MMVLEVVSGYLVPLTIPVAYSMLEAMMRGDCWESSEVSSSDLWGSFLGSLLRLIMFDRTWECAGLAHSW